jgi:quinol monooxygenase YgiN
MSEPFVFIARFRVHDGKGDDLRAAAHTLTAIVDHEETSALGIQVFIAEDDSELLYLHVQPDAAAMDAHMQLTHEGIAAALELADPAEVTICGRPGPLLSQALDVVGQAGATVRILPSHVDGFFRTVLAA